MYCDRETTDVAKSQAGFIKNICLPLYIALNNYLESPQIEEFCIGQLKANLDSWEDSHQKNRLITNYDEQPKSEYNELIKKYSKLKRCETQAPKRSGGNI